MEFRSIPKAFTLIALVNLAGSPALADLPGAVKGGQFAEIKVPLADQLDTNDPVQARERLTQMGVKYLWRMVDDDIVTSAGTLTVRDFMGNGDALASPSDVAKLSCTRKKTKESFLFVGRPFPDDHKGGYLTVAEKNPLTSRLEAGDSFTIGGWVKMMPVSLRDETSPANMPRGYMPLLSRSNSRAYEWFGHLTTERLYVAVNRDNRSPSLSNEQLPWWAHTYGTCWNGQYNEECWHFVAISVDPTKNKVQFVIVRREGNNIPGHTSDFSQIQMTDTVLDRAAVASLAGSELLIGGDKTISMHGLLRGVFFARAALTKEQMKSIATFTAPNKQTVLCHSDDLK